MPPKSSLKTPQRKPSKVKPPSAQSAFRLLREEINAHTGDHSFVFRIKTSVGPKVVPVGRDIALDKHAFQKAMIKKGMLGSSHDMQRLQEFLASEDHPKRFVTARSGWYEDTLVTRYGNMNEGANGEKYRFDTGSWNFEKASRRGGLVDFLTGIAPFLRYSPELVFTYLLALLPPLASRIGRTGGFVVCLSAKSSTGKTTAIRLGQSLSTNADETDLVNFGDTSGVLIDSAAAFGCQLTAFGDIKPGPEKGQQLADKIQTVVFSGVNGKARRRKGEDKPLKANFNVYLLSTESSIEELYAAGERPLQDGDRARLLDVTVPAEGGIFSALPEAKRAETINNLHALLDSQHGRAMPKWAEKLASKPPEHISKHIVAIEEEFLSQLGDLTSLERRIAKHFALIYATGRAGIAARVVPTTEPEMRAAVESIFHRVVRVRQIARQQKHQSFKKLVDVLLDPTSFPIAIIGEAVPDPSRYRRGFRREEPNKGRAMLYVTLEALQALVQEGPETVNELVSRLRSVRVLEVGRSGNSKSVQQAGLHGKPRFLCINLTALQASREEIVG